MDLEMTGLDPATNVIVEIATLGADDDLNVVAEGPDLVGHASEEDLAKMDDVVVEMHTRSGLLDEIRKSEVTLEEAGLATMAFIAEHVRQPRTVPLCGNSIGMDRRFLSVHLPYIEEYLHYRSIDVSTIKELARRWYPGSLDGLTKKASAHRAMDDIKESVAELVYWRGRVFVPASSVAPDGAGAVDAPSTDSTTTDSIATDSIATDSTTVATSPVGERDDALPEVAGNAGVTGNAPS